MYRPNRKPKLHPYKGMAQQGVRSSFRRRLSSFNNRLKRRDKVWHRATKRSLKNFMAQDLKKQISELFKIEQIK